MRRPPLLCDYAARYTKLKTLAATFVVVAVRVLVCPTPAFCCPFCICGLRASCVFFCSEDLLEIRGPSIEEDDTKNCEEIGLHKNFSNLRNTLFRVANSSINLCVPTLDTQPYWPLIGTE